MFFFCPQPKSNHFVSVHNFELPQKEENPPLPKGKERLVISSDHHNIVCL